MTPARLARSGGRDHYGCRVGLQGSRTPFGTFVLGAERTVLVGHELWSAGVHENGPPNSPLLYPSMMLAMEL